MMNWVKGFFGSGGDQPKNGASERAGAETKHSEIPPSPYLNMSEAEIRETLTKDLRYKSIQDVEGMLNTEKDVLVLLEQRKSAKAEGITALETEQKQIVLRYIASGKKDQDLARSLEYKTERLGKHRADLAKMNKRIFAAEICIDECKDALELLVEPVPPVPDVEGIRGQNADARQRNDDRVEQFLGQATFSYESEPMVQEVHLSDAALSAIEEVEREFEGNNQGLGQDMNDLRVPKQPGRERGNFRHKPEDLV